MAKKLKPATVGEKIEMRRFGLMLAQVRADGYSEDARRIEAALRREMLKERRRCSRIVVAYIGSEIGACEMLAKVRSGEAL